ncbi:CNNM domain-containing protein [Halorientalis litorea]|jgi:IMP dehydrogenase|uniref:CNNM domain-containing protein n=1 Tax=Halorientalis litorea TaxID=2931977 RepID=UPI001FF32727|nr:hemolysin family protein [Halorientalis litorea]
MTPLEVGLRLAAGVFLILINAYFVAIEFALTRVRQFPESEFDTPGLRRAWEMTNDLELYLTTCQIWISGTSIALGIVAEPGLAALLEPLFRDTFLASVGAGSLLGFFIINMIHLTHGEQTPTYLGVERSKQVARYGAKPLYYFAWLISPLIKFGDWVAKATLKLFGVEMTGAWLETEEEIIESRADLRNRLDSLLERGDLSEERREEIRNALTVGEEPISAVMTDAEDTVFLSTGCSVAGNLDRIGSSPHTRFPLVGDDPEDFRGIVYVPSVVDRIDELQAGDTTFEDIAAPPMTMGPETTISDAVDQFQAESQELALVLSDGEVVGLLTATDALEAIMGDIEDPLDENVDLSAEGRRLD